MTCFLVEDSIKKEKGVVVIKNLIKEISDP